MGLRYQSALLTLLLLAASPALAETAPAIPRFNEVTAEAGIDSTYTGEWEYMVGGGAAVFDCDEDGLQDLLLAGGSSPASFYRNASQRGGDLRFAKQQSGLEFEKVTGGYPLDIDSDGRMDIVLLRVGENLAMRGLGGCRFERANELWGFDGGDAWSAAMAATWEKGNALPSIAIGNYIDRTQEIAPWGSCTENWLHRPAADGRSYAAPLPLKPSYCALSMLFTDWNRSGIPALRISNDREYYEGGQEQLWRFEPGVEPRLFTDADGWKPLKIWGMGIASRDITGDGFPDYFLTSMADQRFQSLAGGALKPSYKESALTLGITAHRPYTGNDLRPSTGWHAEFADVNNDGLADLFVAKGNVAKMRDFAMEDPNNLLLQKPGGTFLESGAEAGVASLAKGRGAALADFNLDGWLDLVVVNNGAKAQLWQNKGSGSGRFAMVMLAQEAPNRNAIGARLETRIGDKIDSREITIGGGHAGGQAGWIHIGLGESDAADIRVIWPGGDESGWMRLKAGGFYRVEKGRGAAAYPLK
jgi:enediyne biosynthesis protein E4